MDTGELEELRDESISSCIGDSVSDEMRLLSSSFSLQFKSSVSTGGMDRVDDGDDDLCACDGDGDMDSLYRF